MRAAAALVIAITGCGSFGSVPVGDAGAGDVVNDGGTDSAAGDAAGKDAGDGGAAGDAGDAGQGAALVCGGSTCTGTQRCCIGKASRFCGDQCPGFDLACLGTAHCATGKVCCFGATGSVARCESDCTTGRVLCGSEADCDAAGEGGSCQSTTCSSITMNFNVCARGGVRFVDPPGDTGTCSLP